VFVLLRHLLQNTPNKTTLERVKNEDIAVISFLESTVLAAVPPANTVTAQELGLATGGGLGLWTSDGIGTV